DALSILDKIVSFTNGELSYRNTLEHLNILDADYYFRILEAMQQQNLADALLIYDDINRKGFEGDLVLNGLAEFVRNLLVCKDEKVAALLEVVESFKDRYVAAAKGAETLYLISALNVLNEAELNYKSARNKRLHVELVLIKLCYLAQALQVSAGEAGKKKAEQLRPVSFRNIPAMEPVRVTETARVAETAVAPKNGGAKLIVETEMAKGPESAPEDKAPANVVENKAPVSGGAMGGGVSGGAMSGGPVSGGTSGARAAGSPAAGASGMAGRSSLGSLSSIRQQIAGKQSNNEQVQSKALEVEELHRSWQQYADYLRENKNPAVQSLELAELRIVDANNFVAVTSNPLEQKFIENEKRTLSDHLQKAFSNKAISFTVIVEEKEQVEEEPGEKPLNKREQFIQIAEQYPLVKELKDRLRLELDY
ncbi:MAG TPA: DNA polymerase III subunit gamma/tau, partial [Puia sp.]